MNAAGNAINHPETMGRDVHHAGPGLDFTCLLAGAPLPRGLFANDVGYLPDGTPLNRAGNAANHPAPGPLAPGSCPEERAAVDPHLAGSPLHAPPMRRTRDTWQMVRTSSVPAITRCTEGGVSKRCARRQGACSRLSRPV